MLYSDMILLAKFWKTQDLFAPFAFAIRWAKTRLVLQNSDVKNLIEMHEHVHWVKNVSNKYNAIF